MKRFAIGALTVVATLAFAQEGTIEGTTTSTSPIKIYGNVDLNMVKIDTGSDNTDLTANITAGTDAVYMLNTDMGIALGLDFNMVKGKKSGDSMKINYLDIPVSFAYNWVPSADVTSLFAIGPFFGVPLGKWEYDIGAGTAKTKANVAMGLNLENHTTFSINNDFSLGGHVFFKYAFNDLDKDNAEDQTYWSTGLGLSAKFL